MKPNKYSWRDDLAVPVVRVAMIDGKEVQYEVCTSTRQISLDGINSEAKWHYLGAGYIYSINGIVQGYGPDDVMHFWVHK